jgi:hypothetical protein
MREWGGSSAFDQIKAQKQAWKAEPELSRSGMDARSGHTPLEDLSLELR